MRYGLIFQPEFIPKILDGSKTSTMREWDLKKINQDKQNQLWPLKCAKQDGGGNWIFWSTEDQKGLAEFTKKAYPEASGYKPRCKVGDTMYVKETLVVSNFNKAKYKCQNLYVWHDTGMRYSWRWKRDTLSSMFMPYDCTRFEATITSVEPVYLPDIGTAIAVQDGFDNVDTCFNWFEKKYNKLELWLWRITWNKEAR